MPSHLKSVWYPDLRGLLGKPFGRLRRFFIGILPLPDTKIRGEYGAFPNTKQALILIYDRSVDKICGGLAHSARSIDAVMGIRLSQRCAYT